MGMGFSLVSIRLEEGILLLLLPTEYNRRMCEDEIAARAFQAATTTKTDAP